MGVVSCGRMIVETGNLNNNNNHIEKQGPAKLITLHSLPLHMNERKLGECLTKGN